jgi:hypothetical protein
MKAYASTTVSFAKAVRLASTNIPPSQVKQVKQVLTVLGLMSNIYANIANSKYVFFA